MQSAQDRASQRQEDRRVRNEIVGSTLLNSQRDMSFRGTSTLPAPPTEEQRTKALMEARDATRQKLAERKIKREQDELRSTLAWRANIQQSKDRQKSEEEFERSQKAKLEMARSQRKAQQAQYTADVIDAFEHHLERQAGSSPRRTFSGDIPTSASTLLRKDSQRPPTQNGRVVSRVPTATTTTRPPTSSLAAAKPLSATSLPSSLLAEQDHKRILSSHFTHLLPSSPAPLSASLLSPAQEEEAQTLSVINDLDVAITQALEEDDARVRIAAMTQARVASEKQRDEIERARLRKEKEAELLRARYAQVLQSEKERKSARIEAFCRGVATDLIDLSVKVAQFRDSNNGALVPQSLWQEWMHVFKHCCRLEDPSNVEDESSDEEEEVVLDLDGANDDALEVNMNGLVGVRSQWLAGADRALLSALSALDDTRKERERESKSDRKKHKTQTAVSNPVLTFPLPDPAGIGATDVAAITVSSTLSSVSEADLSKAHGRGHAGTGTGAGQGSAYPTPLSGTRTLTSSAFAGSAPHATSTTSLSTASSTAKLPLSTHNSGATAGPRPEKDKVALDLLDDEALRHYVEFKGAWAPTALRHAHNSLLRGTGIPNAGTGAGAGGKGDGNMHVNVSGIGAGMSANSDPDCVPAVPAVLWNGCCCGAATAQAAIALAQGDAATASTDTVTASLATIDRSRASIVPCICGLAGATNVLLSSVVDKLSMVAAQKESVPVPVIISPQQLGLVMLGKPWAGKRTQCQILASRFALQIITPQSVVSEAVKAAQSADPAIFNPRNLAKMAAAVGLPLSGTHAAATKRTGSGSSVNSGILGRSPLSIAACVLEQQLLGYKASKHLAKGECLPEDVVVSLIVNAVQTIRSKRVQYDTQLATSGSPVPVFTVGVNEPPAGLGGFLLLGYPTTQSEAKALEKALSGFEPTRTKRATTNSSGGAGKGRGATAPVVIAEGMQPAHALQPGEPLWTSGFDAVFTLDVSSDLCLQRAAGNAGNDLCEALSNYEAQQPKLFSWFASFGCLRVLDGAAEEKTVATHLDELVVAAIHKATQARRALRESELNAEKAKEAARVQQQERLLFSTEPVSPPQWARGLEAVVKWCSEHKSTPHGIIPASWSSFRDRPLALLLSHAWQYTENTYKRRVRKLFRALRVERKSAMEYMSDTIRAFTTYLRRPDSRFAIVDAFKQTFNALPHDFRRDDACKDELLLRTEELREQLYQVLERRREEAECELMGIANSGCMEYKLVALCVIYLCLVQVEMDRYVSVISIAQHFFACLQDLSTAEPRLPPLVSTKHLASVLAATTTPTPATAVAVQHLSSIANLSPLGDRITALLPCLQSLFETHAGAGVAGGANGGSATGKKATTALAAASLPPVKTTTGASSYPLQSQSKSLISLFALGAHPPAPTPTAAPAKSRHTDPKRASAPAGPVKLVGEHVQGAVESVLSDAIAFAWSQRLSTDVAAQASEEKGKRKKEREKDRADRDKDDGKGGSNAIDDSFGVAVANNDPASLARYHVTTNPTVALTALQSPSEDGYNLSLSASTLHAAVARASAEGAETTEVAAHLQSLIETENALLRTRLSAVYCTCLSEVVSLAAYCRQDVSSVLDKALQAQAKREHDAATNVLSCIRQAVIQEKGLQFTLLTTDGDAMCVDTTMPSMPNTVKTIHAPLQL